MHFFWTIVEISFFWFTEAGILILWSNLHCGYYCNPNVFVGMKKPNVSSILNAHTIYVPNSHDFFDWFIYFTGRHIVYKLSS